MFYRGQKYGEGLGGEGVGVCVSYDICYTGVLLCYTGVLLFPVTIHTHTYKHNKKYMYIIVLVKTIKKNMIL